MLNRLINSVQFLNSKFKALQKKIYECAKKRPVALLIFHMFVYLFPANLKEKRDCTFSSTASPIKFIKYKLFAVPIRLLFINCLKFFRDYYLLLDFHTNAVTLDLDVNITTCDVNMLC